MKSKNVVYETYQDVGEAIITRNFQRWVAEKWPGWTVEDFNFVYKDNYTAIEARLIRDD